VRLELGGGYDSDLRDGARASWVKYGGSLKGSIDLNGHHRTLSLAVTALFVDPLRHEDVIPFTELVSLGGSAPMRAYLMGRMLDRSAFVTTLEYRWPVWEVIDGTINAEFGNVFDSHLEDFNANLLRFSGSIGLQTSAVSDNPLQIVFGVGSETFEQGGKIDSFRLLVGTTTNGI
jgi:outer membrane protein assembly factor BamA